MVCGLMNACGAERKRNVASTAMAHGYCLAIDASECLTHEILQVVSNQIGLLESFVMLYAALVYMTGHSIGPDLGKQPCVSLSYMNSISCPSGLCYGSTDTRAHEQQAESGSK